MIFKRKEKPNALRCSDIVDEFSEYLQRSSRWRGKNGTITAPYEIELIKASLVAEAVKRNCPEFDENARAGFIWLRDLVPGAKHTNLSEARRFSESQIIADLDQEMDSLEREFEQRLALARSFANA